MLVGAQLAFSAKIPEVFCASGSEILYQVQNYFTTVEFTPCLPPIYCKGDYRDCIESLQSFEKKKEWQPWGHPHDGHIYVSLNHFDHISCIFTRPLFLVFYIYDSVPCAFEVVNRFIYFNV